METNTQNKTTTTAQKTDQMVVSAAQQQQSTNSNSQDIYSEFIGAIKIRDGLFIGDQLAAQDYEFVITFIYNLSKYFNVIRNLHFLSN